MFFICAPKKATVVIFISLLKGPVQKREEWHAHLCQKAALGKPLRGESAEEGRMECV